MINPLYNMNTADDESMGLPPENRRAEDPGQMGRSAKKAKGHVGVIASSDETMEEANSNPIQTVEETQNDTVQAMEEEPASPGRSLVSYRDLVAGANVRESVESYSDDDENWDGDDLSDDELEEGENSLKKKLGPGVDICKKERIELCRPWRKSLIIKVLGKEVGYKFLLNKIQKLWSPSGTLDMLDFKNNFFLVMFSSSKDMRYALQEGPWMVAGHYLLCQRWRPEFNPFEDHVRRQAVWIRIPGLPIEYYKKPILWEVGNEVGRTLRVDVHTINEEKVRNGVRSTERAQFARICVEVDLRKPLLAKVRVRKTFYNVEYEGLPLICFECGRFGHRLEHCPSKFAPPSATADGGVRPAPRSFQGPIKVSEACEKEGENFGPWMIAQRNNRRPRYQWDSSQKNQGGVNLTNAEKETEKLKGFYRGGGGNRFGVIADLAEENNEALDEMVESAAHINVQKSKGIARNLNADLEGHRIIPNSANIQKSPTKQQLADPSGSRSNNRKSGESSSKSTQGPIREIQNNKVMSPNKNKPHGRNKDKALVVRPLRDSRAQNIPPRKSQRDREPPHKPNFPAALVKSGPDLNRKGTVPDLSADEITRLMRYARQRLDDQGMDSLDELPVLQIHNDGF